MPALPASASPAPASPTPASAIPAPEIAIPPAAKDRDGAHTIGRMLIQSASRFASNPAILHKVKASYQTITYSELFQHAALLASGFRSLDLGTGQRVAIVSENRPEWVYVDLACQILGITDVPIYPSLPSGQIQYILRDSGARAIVVSDASQLKKILEAWPELPDLATVIVMDGRPEGTPPEQESGRRVLSLEEVRQSGADNPLSEAELREACEGIKPEDLASIVYTSGTTGDPKGAMLSQWNFMSNCNTVAHIINVGPGHVFLSFLPLNHVFERLAGYYLPLRSGSAIAYAESALRVKQNLPEVRPTVMIGVPRLYDGMMEGVLASVAKAPEKQQKLFAWATGVGKRRAEALEKGKTPGPLIGVQWALADRLVLEKIRTKLGCDRLRYFVSGSAPLPRATADFLLSIGIQFLEGWGLTETSPVVCVNRPGHFRIGSVGPAIPGVEVRIAEDGEILCRGPNIMQGYLNKPEATAEAIDPDGWFHTGDIGRIDEDGFVFITDRKKDLLVLATGKKVAPQPIEGRLKASAYIREIVVLGDRMSSCIALVVPALDRLAEEGKKRGWKFENESDLCRLPEAKKLVREEIDRLSVGLADYEKIRGLALLDREFTIESGELTPTLKVKRKVVAANYADLIKSLSG